jgi:hypothetical protein
MRLRPRVCRLNTCRISPRCADAGCVPDAILEHSDNMKRLLMLTSVAAMIGMAAPAYADPSGNDSDFLKHLSNAGLTYQDPDKAITVAKSVCDLVDKGTSGKDIVDNLQQNNPGFTGDGASKFTAIAASDYCPKYVAGQGQPANGQPANQGQPPSGQPANEGQPASGQPANQGQPPSGQPANEGQPPSETQPANEGQPPKPPGA